jgi:hypothetical protein
MRLRSHPIGRAILLALVVAALAACSPEAGRPRGGGPGAMGDNVPSGGVVPKSKVFSDVEP